MRANHLDGDHGIMPLNPGTGFIPNFEVLGSSRSGPELERDRISITQGARVLFLLYFLDLFILCRRLPFGRGTRETSERYFHASLRT